MPPMKRKEANINNEIKYHGADLAAALKCPKNSEIWYYIMCLIDSCK